MPTDPNDTSWLDSIASDLDAEKAERERLRREFDEEMEKLRAAAPEVECYRCKRKCRTAVPADVAIDGVEMRILCDRCGRAALRAAARNGHLRGPF